MLCLFLLLRFRPRDLTLSNGHTIIAKASTRLGRLLTTYTDSWYYLNADRDVALESFRDGNPHFSLIKRNWAVAFLTASRARELSATPGVRVVANTPSLKASNVSSTNTYLVRATSCKLGRLLLPDHFLVHTTNLSVLQHDPLVFSIYPISSPKLLNRWSSGLLQSGTQSFGVNSAGRFESTRTINERGLNGSGVIVALLDTGVDIGSQFFFDADVELPINRTDMRHRKIVRYDAFVDATDKFSGHGTHAGGTICGSAVCGAALDLYRGHAPGARLYVADMGVDLPDSDVIILSGVADALNAWQVLKSPIVSCSWGLDEDIPEIRFIFDALTEINDSFLFVFAAGNYGETFSINSPGNAKNVLTVGAVTPPVGFYTGDATSSAVLIVSDQGNFSVTSASFSARMRSDPLATFQNLSVTTDILANATGKLFVVDPVQVQAAVSLGAIGVVSTSTAGSDAVPVFIASAQDFAKMQNASTASIFLSTTHSSTLSVASYSSRGPTASGLVKPEVVAPGTYIGSAGRGSTACNTSEGVQLMSGTSMATPAISGSVALVVQYLTESWHQLPTNTTITPALLRAFMVQSTVVARPSQSSGYWLPVLERSLVFPEDFTSRGLRFVTGWLGSGYEYNYTVVTKSASEPLAITLAWTDHAVDIGADDILLPIILDLDLYVIDPAGKVVFGNMQPEEDSLSTVEKIIIETPQVGTYRIHVKANPSFVPENVSFALIVNGPFAHLDLTVNPIDLQAKRGAAHQERCDPLHSGTFCGIVVTELEQGKKQQFQIHPRAYHHFHVTFPNGFDGNFKFKSEIGSAFYGIVRLILNDDNRWKLGLPRSMVGVQSSSEDVTVDLGRPIPTEIYLSVFADVYQDILYTITWGDAGTKSLQVVLIVAGSVLVVGLAVIAAVIICRRIRVQRQAETEPDVDLPLVDERRQHLTEVTDDERAYQ